MNKELKKLKKFEGEIAHIEALLLKTKKGELYMFYNNKCFTVKEKKK